MEVARTMASLSPVVRMHRPTWVVKKNSTSATTAAQSRKPTMMRAACLSSPVASWNMENSVGEPRMEMFGLPLSMISRLMEYRPDMVMMPARIGGILAFVWRKAVMQPASAPAIIATISARPG